MQASKHELEDTYARPQRIAVVRALFLGDMLCAVPALRSLRAQWPTAEITLVGLPWARALVPRLAPLVDRFEEFPGFPGIPERAFDAAQTVRFLEQMQSAHFDLVVQLHGSGSHINEFAALFGARHLAAFDRGGENVIGDGTFVGWPEHGSEAERLLALPLALECPNTGTHLELDVTPLDRATARALLGEADDARPYVCVHPGARFPSRRWPPDRFAAVADHLADKGFRIVLTGTDAERPITTAVRRGMRASVVDLTGQLELGALAGLVGDAAAVVCNDTGVSHVAAAVGTRSVVIASGSDVARWAPSDADRHHVLWHAVPCRPCLHEVCPIGHPCAAGVSVDRVIAELDSLMKTENANV